MERPRKPAKQIVGATLSILPASVVRPSNAKTTYKLAELLSKCAGQEKLKGISRLTIPTTKRRHEYTSFIHFPFTKMVLESQSVFLDTH